MDTRAYLQSLEAELYTTPGRAFVAGAQVGNAAMKAVEAKSRGKRPLQTRPATTPRRDDPGVAPIAGTLPATDPTKDYCNEEKKYESDEPEIDLDTSDFKNSRNPPEINVDMDTSDFKHSRHGEPDNLVDMDLSDFQPKPKKTYQAEDWQAGREPGEVEKIKQLAVERGIPEEKAASEYDKQTYLKSLDDETKEYGFMSDLRDLKDKVHEIPIASAPSLGNQLARADAAWEMGPWGQTPQVAQAVKQRKASQAERKQRQAS